MREALEDSTGKSTFGHTLLFLSCGETDTTYEASYQHAHTNAKVWASPLKQRAFTQVCGTYSFISFLGKLLPAGWANR